MKHSELIASVEGMAMGEGSLSASASCWVQVTAYGQTYFMNTVTQETSWEPPTCFEGATNCGWNVAERSPTLNETISQELSFSDPDIIAASEPLLQIPSAAAATDVASTEQENLWVEIFNPQIGRSYFMHATTNETRWDKPPNWPNLYHGLREQNINVLPSTITEKLPSPPRTRFVITPGGKVASPTVSASPLLKVVNSHRSTFREEQQDAQQQQDQIRVHGQQEKDRMHRSSNNSSAIVCEPLKGVSGTSISSPIKKEEEVAAGDDIVELQRRVLSIIDEADVDLSDNASAIISPTSTDPQSDTEKQLELKNEANDLNSKNSNKGASTFMQMSGSSGPGDAPATPPASSSSPAARSRLGVFLQQMPPEYSRSSTAKHLVKVEVVTKEVSEAEIEAEVGESEKSTLTPEVNEASSSCLQEVNEMSLSPERGLSPAEMIQIARQTQGQGQKRTKSSLSMTPPLPPVLRVAESSSTQSSPSPSTSSLHSLRTFSRTSSRSSSPQPLHQRQRFEHGYRDWWQPPPPPASNAEEVEAEGFDARSIPPSHLPSSVSASHVSTSAFSSAFSTACASASKQQPGFDALPFSPSSASFLLHSRTRQQRVRSSGQSPHPHTLLTSPAFSQPHTHQQVPEGHRHGHLQSRSPFHQQSFSPQSSPPSSAPPRTAGTTSSGQRNISSYHQSRCSLPSPSLSARVSATLAAVFSPSPSSHSDSLQEGRHGSDSPTSSVRSQVSHRSHHSHSRHSPPPSLPPLSPTSDLLEFKADGNGSESGWEREQVQQIQVQEQTRLNVVRGGACSGTDAQVQEEHNFYLDSHGQHHRKHSRPPTHEHPSEEQEQDEHGRSEYEFLHPQSQSFGSQASPHLHSCHSSHARLLDPQAIFKSALVSAATASACSSISFPSSGNKSSARGPGSQIRAMHHQSHRSPPSADDHQQREYHESDLVGFSPRDSLTQRAPPRTAQTASEIAAAAGAAAGAVIASQGGTPSEAAAAAASAARAAGGTHNDVAAAAGAAAGAVVASQGGSAAEAGYAAATAARAAAACVTAGEAAGMGVCMYSAGSPRSLSRVIEQEQEQEQEHKHIQSECKKDVDKAQQQIHNRSHSSTINSVLDGDGAVASEAGDEDYGELKEVDVAAIIGHRIKRREGTGSGTADQVEVQYRVRWQGFTEADDEWVDRFELADAEEPAPSLLGEYEQRHGLSTEGMRKALASQVAAKSNQSSMAAADSKTDGAGDASSGNGHAGRGRIERTGSADEFVDSISLHGQGIDHSYNAYSTPTRTSLTGSTSAHLFSPPPDTSPPPPPPAVKSSSKPSLLPQPPRSPPPPLPPQLQSSESKPWWREMAAKKQQQKRTADAPEAGCSGQFCRQQ